MSNCKCQIESRQGGAACCDDCRPAVSCRTPHSALRTPHSGFTYVALLAAIVIIGISMSAAGKYWQNVMLREKEEELLFRGDQYRLAVERYYLAKAPNVFPANLDDLLKDDRFPQAKRHLRRKYPDPITGEDFEVIRDLTKGNRITGVCSASEKEPLKKRDFPEHYGDFEGKDKYRDWKFQYVPQQQPAPGGQPDRPPVRPPTGTSPFSPGHPSFPGPGSGSGP